MNKKYNLKLDLQFRCNNSTMKFDEFDNNTSDFFIRVTRAGELIDISKAIVTLVVIKPDNSVDAQFVDIDSNRAYCDLKPTMKNLVGKYEAIASITVDGETVNTGIDNPIIYEVTENKFLRQLNQKVVTEERFTLLTDMINRLSTIEISEEQRVINEAERILSEENRKIEEAKRVEAELIRQHEEADRAKYDATRESNENIRKQNESIRLANETNRIDEEVKRVEEENKRKLAEEERNANYNFMTEDEDRRRSEANAHKEAEKLRAQAEYTRVNEEAKRRTTEQARVSAENTRVNNENTRETNETTRQTNETHRIEAETQRQNRYNSFILDAEANANNFENYTNTAKVKEEERKSNELDRKSQEDRRVSNEVERISNENTRKANEVAREKNETSRQYVFENKVDEVDKKIIEINTTKDNFVSNINTKVDTKISELNTTKDNFVSSISTKVDSEISELDSAKSDMTNTVLNKVNEVESRFNALTSKQQQDAEVIDARDGETSLKARLDRDIEKAKQVYVNVEGNSISTDSSVGYLKDIEILGNTIQSASNLADIRSVGDKVEGQELYEIPVLSVGKNIFNKIFKAELEKCNIVTVSEQGVVTLNGTLSTHYIFNVVIPKGKYRATTFSDSRMALHVFWDGGDNGFQQNKTLSYTEDTTIQCYIASGTYDNHICKFQIEEGTQATSYEPYVEDKLTILSPTPLEKVGDVRDRIIEKDGVWGVEDNSVDILFNETNCTITMSNASDIHPNYAVFDFTVVDNKNYVKTSLLFCNKFNHLLYSADRNSSDKEGCWIGNAVFFTVKILKSKLESVDVNGMKKWLKTNNINLKYLTTQPQFIPLPHDQQIKLRTFANKTNISFLTEIGGTIKAQVPKSLGATVNTHTEQISNLNKELDRVKKLEESTVSTVTTESDFTTVEQTTNGYFEDVKLEGKTLVNLSDIKQFSISGAGVSIHTNIDKIKPNATYTRIVYITKNTLVGANERGMVGQLNDGERVILNKDIQIAQNFVGLLDCSKYTISDITREKLSSVRIFSVNTGGVLEGYEIILEGDHTQNPPSGYIEGLKSVGDTTDEISVESVNENLFDETKISYPYIVKVGEKSNGKNLNVIKVKPNTTYTFKAKATNGIVGRVLCILGDKKIKFDGNTNTQSTIFNYFRDNYANGRVFEYKQLNQNPITFTTYNDTNYVYINADCSANGVDEWVIESIQLNEGLQIKEYTPHQSDKKRLLYYNEETQTWEKPILREWDSIEKHANGKYYYHQRSGEVVLNGSENWILNSTYSNDTYTTVQVKIDDAKFNGESICNIFNKSKNYGSEEGVNIAYQNYIYLSISKSKLSTQDVQGFKQWLQANNITVVYQLAQEKVYECTNIDLITYANETNYVVESGVLSPKTTLKVHSNISNVVSLLQKKVSLLESNVKASQEVQDMMILETDMRMLDIELALMEFIPMKLNLGGSDMLRSATYFNFLKNHIINETYEKEYLENVMNKYLATGRINQDEYNELYKMLYPPVYDIELPIEY